MTRFLRWEELSKIVPLHRTTIWRLERAGLFPRRKKIGPNSIAWLESDIQDWLATYTTNTNHKSVKDERNSK